MSVICQDTRMISYAEALQLLLATAVASRARRTTHNVPLTAAIGCISGTDLASRLDVPGFANSALDGYVLRASDSAAASAAAPLSLAVSGQIVAGAAAPAAGPHSVFEIFTGAPIPAGLDAVVPLEQVDITPAAGGHRGSHAAAIRLGRPLRIGQNIRQAGEDFRQGQRIIAAGTRLTPHHLMALAACGLDEIDVLQPPKVAILTTGSELTMRGAELSPGRIRDANGPYLSTLMPLLGTRLEAATTAGDDAADLETRLRALADRADIVLVTGGVSAGKLDLVPAAVRALGGEIIFHKVAIRPGKPLLHARLPNGALLFGLPGNPLAVAVGMRFFVIPALRALQAQPPEAPSTAVTPIAVRGRGTLRFFAKARVAITAAGHREVEILPGQESFRISPLLEANCWAIVTEGIEEVPAGGLIETLPLYPED